MNSLNMATTKIKDQQLKVTKPLWTNSQQTTGTAMPRNVHTTFNYYKDPGDGTEHASSLAGKRATFNQPSIDLEHVVTDITGSGDTYTLDSHGFQLFSHASEEKDFLDDAHIKAIYYPEIEKLVYDMYSYLSHRSFEAHLMPSELVPRVSTFSITQYVDRIPLLSIRMMNVDQ